MSKDIAIKIENLSKQYRLGVVGTGTLSHDLKRWWTTSIRGKEDPYLKIGEANDRATKGNSEYVWALKDINLEIGKGDIVGIIGKNGAGKSTLLKLLSRVTKPTTGNIKYKGRIASLLEVGTGFHPEMTGRENIYMNGAIMGMTKNEITSKLDEIIDFAGIERYIDTPTKRYSSGMTVRLGFSIAAHLEPDILVVDEVLAVGDAEFQKKAIGKMQDVSKGGGRTVLFVSHNMTAVKSLCTSGILLKNGTVKHIGAINDVVDNYLKLTVAGGIKNNFWQKSTAPGTDVIKIKSAYVVCKGDSITVNDDFNIITEFWCEQEVFSFNLSTVILNENNVNICNIISKTTILKTGLYKVILPIPSNLMNDGFYTIDNYFVSNSKVHFVQHGANSFEILDAREGVSWYGKWTGAVRPTFIQPEIIPIII